MSIFYEHLSTDEREMMVLENSFDLEIRTLGAAFDAVCEATKLDMLEAENKVIMESGTTDDLSVLFEAAAGEGAEKSKGILSKIFEAIKNFITNVKNKVKNLFTKEKAEELKNEKEVTDNGVLDTVNGKLGAFMTEAKTKFAKIVHGGDVSEEDISNLKSKAKKIGISAGAIVGANVAGKVLYDKIMKGSKEIEIAENATNVLQSLYASAKDGKDDQKLKSILSSVSEAIKNSSGALFNTINVKIKAVKGRHEVAKALKDDDTKVVNASTEDNFEDLLNGYSFATEDTDPDGTEAGSLDDLKNALAIL